MFKRRGSTLLDVLFGVFLVSLISAALLPILFQAGKNLSSNRKADKALSICSDTIEYMKSYDKDLDYDLYGHSLNLIFTRLQSSNTYVIDYPNYLIEIEKTQTEEELWYIKVIVSYSNNNKIHKKEVGCYIIP